jgi:hypothetical protein
MRQMIESLERRTLFQIDYVYEYFDDQGHNIEMDAAYVWNIDPTTNRSGDYAAQVHFSDLPPHNEIQVAMELMCSVCTLDGEFDTDLIEFSILDGAGATIGHSWENGHNAPEHLFTLAHDDDELFVDFDVDGFEPWDISHVKSVRLFVARTEIDVVVVQDAVEGGQDGKFRVVRSGDWGVDTDVQFMVHTTTGATDAINGTDYTSLDGNYDFDWNDPNKYIVIDAIADGLAEPGGYEYAGFWITCSSVYILNDPNQFGLNIYDNP